MLPEFPMQEARVADSPRRSKTKSLLPLLVRDGANGAKNKKGADVI
jgi:hypothetical protein